MGVAAQLKNQPRERKTPPDLAELRARLESIVPAIKERAGATEKACRVPDLQWSAPLSSGRNVRPLGAS